MALLICDAFCDFGTCCGTTSSSENVILIDVTILNMATELIGVSSTFKLVNRNAYFTLTSVFYRIRVFILCTPDIDRNLVTK